MARFLPHLSLACALLLTSLVCAACSDDSGNKTDAGDDGAAAEAGTPPTEAGADSQVNGDQSSASSPCALACQSPEQGPCAGEAPEDCVADCEANIQGVTAACAECLLLRTGWYGQICSCDSAEGCCFTVFLPGAEDVRHCHELVNCEDDAYATQCMGYSVGTKLAPSCAAACASSVRDAGP